MASDHEALQAVLDANDQPVFALDRELRYTAFNRAHAVVMRALYGADIALGGRLPDYQSVAADRETSTANLERALAGERVTATAFSGEHESRRSFEVVHVPQTDAAGTVIGVVVRAYDVTERQRAEAALSQNRTLLARVVETTNDAVYVKDTAGRYLLFNAGAERITGKRAADVLGKDDRFVFPADEAAVVMDGDRAVMDGGVQATYEETVTDAAGTLSTFLSTKGPIYDEGGELQGLFGIARDISERRRAEEQLRESEEKFKYIFDYSQLGKSITLLTGELHVNRAFCQMLGYSQDELEHTRWQDITPPEDIELTQEQPDPVLAGQSDEARFVKRYRHKDGSIVWGDVATSLRRDEAGEPLYFVTAVSDITEQKLAQESLQASEERYRMLVDHMTSGVVVYEPTADEEDFIIREFNTAAQRIEQLARHKVVGRLVTAAFPGVEEFGLLEVLRRVARTGEPEEFPTAFYQDQRLASWRENHLYRLPSGEIVAVYEDVTQRILAEREAAYATELMERAEEIGHAGGWEYDVAGDRVSWTDEVYRIHGLAPDYDPNDVGRDIDFYSAEGSMLVAEAFRRAVEEGEAYDLEVELDRADGSRIWVRTIGRPIVEDGIVVRVLGNIMDVSERRRAEEEILSLNAELEQRVQSRTAELDAANRELEAFAYSVSHDLRAPLRHISGFASILAEDAANSLDENARGCLDTITDSVREMGVLIDDLLQFSRVGRMETQIVDVDMEEILSEALVPIREETADRAIEWSVGPLPHVLGDHNLLRQVWANLVGNAVKYSRDRSPARIEIGALDGDADPRDCVFFVRDNGVGFDMQYAGNLFRVFQRLHSSAEFEGTGIGLANVQRIVARLGGRVWAEAELDQGATFSFALPRTKEAR